MEKKFSALKDVELLRLMLAGDVSAFEELYDRKQPCVYRFALRMSGSENIAEDVTQEVFMALMRDGHQYDERRGNLSTYLYAIARYRVLRFLEKDRAFVSIQDECDDDDEMTYKHFTTDEDLSFNLAQGEIVEKVRQAILALPLRYREAVVLCNLHEMTYEEAANITGCAVGTIRSRLHRARSMLLEKLSATNEPNEFRQLLLSKRYAI